MNSTVFKRRPTWHDILAKVYRWTIANKYVVVGCLRLSKIMRTVVRHQTQTVYFGSVIFPPFKMAEFITNFCN